MKPIRDPEFPKEPIHMMPQKMKMRNIKTLELKAGTKVTSKPPTNAANDPLKDLERVCRQDRFIDIFSLAQFIVSSELEAVNENKAFLIKNSAKRLSCGPLLQRIPMGAYVRIGGGESIAHDKAPIQNNPNPIFKFDRKRQIALRVGSTVGRDYVIVVAANGCILLETGAYASFHMPVFIVEQTGDFYKVNGGNRILLLGPGSHLILYTNEAPVLFVRKNTATRKQSVLDVPKSDPQKSLKQEKTGSAVGSRDSDKTASQDSSKTASKDSSKTASQDVPKASSQDIPKKAPPPIVQDDSATPVKQVTVVSQAPIVIQAPVAKEDTSESPISAIGSPSSSASKKPISSVSKPTLSVTPVREQPVAEPKPMVTSPKTLKSTLPTGQSSVRTRYPATINIGQPIPQTREQTALEPEVVRVHSRRSRVIKFVILLLLFVLLLFLFVKYRRAGATGPRLPKKTCKNCGRHFEPRD